LDKLLFKQPSLTITQQLTLLQEKGLIIDDLDSAEHWLSYNSYFRFKYYSDSFKDYKNGNGNYIPSTKFEVIRDLYLFDRKIKMLIFGALENIEIAVKTQLTNIMAAAYGPHWYIDAGHFISEQERKQIIRNARIDQDIPKGFDHATFLSGIEEYMKNPVEHFLKTYKNTYEPLHPPSWMMVEIITFGTLSILFENLKPCDEKTMIHDHFGLTKKHFVSWLHSFSFIRNKCAHHARLVYEKINFAPALPQRKSRQFLVEAEEVDHASLYAVLCCIQHMIGTCNKISLFKEQLLSLIDAYQSIDYKRLGFTDHWREEPIWILTT
jgi:abortive infection bacteriophage resistance protein